MATQYPTALDGEAQLDTSIAPTATLGNPSHSDQHENVNGAVQALEAKLGIGASAAASSTDQMVLVSDGSGTSWGYRGVAVFADAAARDAAVTSPGEGMTAYLQDANSVTVYSGSAWVTIADLEVLVVDSANGRVGIGTSSPLGALDIHGNTESLIFSSPSNTNRYRIDANITDAADFGLSIGYWDGIASDYKRTITFDDSGKVGIGTTTPSEELEVSTAGNTYVKVASTVSTKQVGLTLVVPDAVSGTDYWTIYHDDLTGHDLTFFSDGAKQAAISTTGDFEVTTDGTNFYGLGKYYESNNTINISGSTTWTTLASISVPKGRWLCIATGRMEYSLPSSGRNFGWRIGNISSGAVGNGVATTTVPNTSTYLNMSISSVMVTGSPQTLGVQVQQNTTSGAGGETVLALGYLQIIGVH